MVNCSIDTDCQMSNNGNVTGERMRTTTAEGRKLWKISYYTGNVHRNQDLPKPQCISSVLNTCYIAI